MASAERKETKKTRARVAAPGARRLVLTGIMAVPDDFGRVRVLLADPLPSGAPDRTWQTLQAEARLHSGTTPFKLRPPDDTGDRGEFWAVPPRHRKEYWLKTATDLRGKEVRVEVTVRVFAIWPGAGEAGKSNVEAARAQMRVAGFSFDLSLVEPLSAAPRGAAAKGLASDHVAGGRRKPG